MMIVIDPGHGGDSRIGGSSPNNATGPLGLLEKTVTFDIGLRLQALLEAGLHQVVMTRSSDRNLGLADRAKVARDNDADVFLSIHFNGFDDQTVQGTETFVHEDAVNRSQVLAEGVQKKTLAATGYRDRGVKRARFGVLDPGRHKESTAACLAELSFMTDPGEEARLMTDSYKDRLAKALEEAILGFDALASRVDAPS